MFLVLGGVVVFLVVDVSWFRGERDELSSVTRTHTQNTHTFEMVAGVFF